jgi:SAM-dependent methyltransferase
MSARASSSKRDAWRDPRVAREYEERRFVGPLARLKHRRDVELALSMLGRPSERDRALDLATGTGRMARALAQSGWRVVGADVSREMLAARAAGSGPAVQADALHLPFADKSFDAALAMRFLFHLGHRADRMRALAELARVTRGPIVFEVRYRATAKQALRFARSRLGLARRWKPAQGRAEIAAELTAAGLELVALAPKSRLFSDKALALARPR